MQVKKTFSGAAVQVELKLSQNSYEAMNRLRYLNTIDPKLVDAVFDEQIDISGEEKSLKANIEYLRDRADILAEAVEILTADKPEFSHPDAALLDQVYAWRGVKDKPHCPNRLSNKISQITLYDLRAAL